MAIDRRFSTIECPRELANSFYLRLAKSAGFGREFFRGVMTVSVNIRKPAAAARARKRARGRKKTGRSRGR
jgi:hypothetical protein